METSVLKLGTLLLWLCFVVKDFVHCSPKIAQDKKGKDLVDRSGKKYRFRVEKPQFAAESKPVSFINEEKIAERHLSDVKVRIENKLLLSMWVPVEGTEVRIDFKPNTNTMWEGKVPYVVRGEKNNSLRFQSYDKQCHFRSHTPSALAHMSTCDGSLTGTIILKNEIYIVDPHFLRRVNLVNSNTNSTTNSSSEGDSSGENLSNEKYSLEIGPVDKILVKEQLTLSFNVPSSENTTPLFDESSGNFTRNLTTQFNETASNNDIDYLIDIMTVKSTNLVNGTSDQTRTFDNETYTTNSIQKQISHDIQSNEEAAVTIVDEMEWDHPEAPLITHTIRKRSIGETFDPDFCGVSKVEIVPTDPDEQKGMAIMENVQAIDYDRWNKELVLELAVFVDSYLMHKYMTKYDNNKKVAQEQLQDFIASTLNNAQLMYQHESIRPKVQFRIVRYEVFDSQPYELDSSPDSEKYLNRFCDYQYYLRSREFNWDHAVLFTGQDITRPGGYNKVDHSISGIARLLGVCHSQNSCLLAEAVDFNAAFILAHEIGHSLGMLHDEPFCSSSFIMSASLGAGKVVWSTCSVSGFQKYLNTLDSENRNCMLTLIQYKEPKFQLSTDDLPGTRYSAKDQCALVYGQEYYPEHAYNTKGDMCYLLWCRKKGGGQYLSSHPALEGTQCGSGKWCRNGECTEINSGLSVLIHGGWSRWSIVDCKHCTCPDIDNSLAVVKVYRTCTDPAPSNGGNQCPGSNIRGLVCDRSCSAKAFSKVTVDQYITQICSAKKLKHHGWNIIGTGRQMTFYEDRACHIFCDVKTTAGANKKTSWGDILPNGTPCGNGRYCLDGQCLTLGCDSTTLVSTESDCPLSAEQKCLSPLHEPIVTWTAWSDWSPCSATCGLGVKKKARTCVAVAPGSSQSVLASGCLGHDAEKSSCSQKPCPDSEHDGQQLKKQNNYDEWYQTYSEYTSWGEWNACSATCGQGVQKRDRSCRSISRCFGPDRQERECYAPACPAWGGWGYWSSCGHTMNRRRIRKCYGGDEVCPGNEMDIQIC